MGLLKVSKKIKWMREGGREREKEGIEKMKIIKRAGGNLIKEN